MEKYITKSAKETQKIAVKFARQILRQKPGKSALVLGLQGDLGVGKTTFLQGFAKGMGIKEKINSPTFVIMKRFLIKTEKSQKIPVLQIGNVAYLQYRYFYHFDCYRLNSAREILETVP